MLVKYLSETCFNIVKNQFRQKDFERIFETSYTNVKNSDTPDWQWKFNVFYANSRFKGRESNYDNRNLLLLLLLLLLPLLLLLLWLPLLLLLLNAYSEQNLVMHNNHQNDLKWAHWCSIGKRRFTSWHHWIHFLDQPNGISDF